MESTAPDQHVQTMQANWDKGDVSMREENGTVGIVSVPAEAINNPWSSDGTATTPIHSTASEVGTVSNNAWREENHNEDGDDETGADDDGEKSSEPDLVFATEENESIARDMWGNPTRFKPVPILATSASDSTPSLAASRQSARVFWKKFSGKFMPQQAIPIGRDGDGAPLFSTRVVYKDGLQVGKGRNQAGCYLSYEGKEILLAEDVEYEVLCGDAEGIEWIPSSGKLSNSLISSDRLIQGGRESNGDQLFVGLCDTYFHGSQVGKCGQHLSGLHYPYDGKETIVSQYRVAAYGQILEMDDVALSLCEDVESINEQGTLSSVHWRTYSSSMPDAIRLGRDTDGTPLYAGRSKVKKGGVQVGKIRGDTCFIPFGGKELLFKKDFEVLCGDSRLIDLVEVDGKISLMRIADLKPIESGTESNGMPLYIGIHEAHGSIQIGKCSPSLKGCHYSYGGKEYVGEKYRMVVFH